MEILLTEKLSFTIIRSFKRQKLSSTILWNLDMSKLHGSVEKKKKKKNSNGARDTRFTIETKKRILMVHEILDSQSKQKKEF